MIYRGKDGAHNVETAFLLVFLAVSSLLFYLSLTVFNAGSFRADLDYLLFLQGIREHAGQFINTLFVCITDLGSTYPTLILLAVVYYGIDTDLGKNMVRMAGLSFMLNGIMKLSVCAFRPWVRDTSIVPLQKATGYSFPSGHTSNAVSTYGTLGMQVRDKNKCLSVFMLILVLLIGFSRNYVGAHTPQDVVTGFCSSAALLIAMIKIKRITGGKDAKKVGWIFLGITAIICIISVIFFEIRPYPVPPVVNGEALADTGVLIIDSFEAVGILIGVAAVDVLHAYIPECRTENTPITVKIRRIVVGLLVILSVKIGLKPVFSIFLPFRYTKVLLNFFIIFIGLGVYSCIEKKIRDKTFGR